MEELPPMPLAVLLCLLATIVIFVARRERAQATIHQIGDPAMAYRALIDHADDFANWPAAMFPVHLATWRAGERNENMTTSNYGPHWRALRCNLTAGILHPSCLGSLAPLRQEATQALIADLSTQGGEVAIRGPTTTAVFALVTRLCFGDMVDEGQQQTIGRVIQDTLVAIGKISTRFSGSMLSKLVNRRGLRQISILFERQADLYLPLVEERRQSQSRLCGGVVHPYVDSLLHLCIPDGNGDAKRALRDGELVGLVFEFLGAGTGSVVTCIEWTLAHLIYQPEVQNKLRREIEDEANGEVTVSSKSIRNMPYLNAVVLESLRMHPPLSFILRGAHGEGAKAIGMDTIPAQGLNVLFNLGDIARDEKMWTDPHQYRPERFLAGGEAEHVGPTPCQKEIRMMPFGAGHRHCPGMAMGMLHVKCFLASLVREFEWAPGAGGIDMAELDGFLKVMKRPLSARVTRRS